ncbi:MAG TPA: adenylyltransferase/cytidyltransferase family protein [Armatimonadota bacterium]|jgi:rfaE bifunctional protein nucleotidyltransferase chain/domain
MNYPYVYTTQGTLMSVEAMLAEIAPRRAAGHRVITTNGCFDLLHPGHVSFLEQARSLGDLLVVGMNCDETVTRLKGPGRPLLKEVDRAGLLAAMRCVDYVLVFAESLPNAWLELVTPTLHCKAGDYTVEDLPEAAVVRAHGGDIAILPLREGFSTSAIVGRVIASSQNAPGATAQASDDALQDFLSASNVLRQTGYRLAETVADVAMQVQAVLRQGGQLFVADAQGTADFAQEWRAGDILLLLVTTDEVTAEMLDTAREAKAMGLQVIALTPETPSPLREVSDVLLAVPAQSPAHVQLAQLAIMQQVEQLVLAAADTLQESCS